MSKSDHPTNSKPVEELRHDSEERYRAFIASSSEGIWRCELEQPLRVDLSADEQIDFYYEHGYIAECNDAMARICGFDRAGELVGARLGDLLLCANPANDKLLRAFISSGFHLVDVESSQRNKAGREKFFTNTLTGIIEDGFLNRFWGTQRDITERKRTEQRFALLHGITQLIAEKTPSENVGPAILQLICESLNWEIGALWRVEKAAGVIVCLDVWTKPTVEGGDFERTSLGMSFTPGEGFPGVVWQSGELRWVEDFSKTRFPRMPLAANEGIHGAVCFPLKVRSDIIGVMEFFSREIRVPDEKIAELMTAIGNQIAQLIERGQVEQARRESEERYRTLAQTASDGIISIDETSAILFVNPAAGRIFGYTISEMLGQCLTMLMPDYLRHLHRTGIKRYLDTSQRHISWDGVELPGLHKDGAEIPLEISFGESHIEGKRLFTGIVRDISERKRVEQLLRESEQRYRTMADTAPVLIWEAGTDKLCYSVNKAWLDFTGRKMEDELGNGWLESVHSDDLEQCRSVYGQSFAVHESFTMELRLRRADGEYRWVVNRGVPRFASDNSFVGYIGSCVDISERKQAEDERNRLLENEQEARRKAEEASRLKDEFLATVSHELRTPLTAVVGWARMLQSEHLDEKTSKEALEAIARNAKSQAQLIDDLLDVSRIITGRLRLEVRSIDPVSLIESAMEAVRPAAEAKGVRLQKVIDTAIGFIAGDPQRLQQVVWNLLSNAIRYTPRGGRVETKLERINSSIEIAVSDTGGGISPDFLPYVFDRFRQADMSTTREHGGLGLGLSIVRHLVELHGGSVRAESEGEGRGARFIVRLPLIGVYQKEGEPPERRAVSASPDEFEACPRLDDVRVLVVDDEADTRAVLQRMLSHYGAEVIALGSATEAIGEFNRSKFDLLICDIGMPGVDGYDLIRKIRARSDSGAKVPAIALTAYARAEDRLRALRAGYQMHVPKPVEVRELLAIVASLVQRSE